ncbi:penicillin-binding protein 1A [Xylophilus sp. Leaf220]|uniref:penicillin-binding protein 1A n=1 Tax=Xylophilus sp. Leaf220 TaxID=1735686 RepID=UPI0006F7F573|nr:penicillin-binding protein [Xylophilus sp. Leaf220]
MKNNPLSRSWAALAAVAGRAALAVRRHPWISLALLPALVLLYVLLLIPFTPSIGDIRKARDERPAVLLSADGKVLAEFRRANREWVPLAKVSPHVVAALISTEDHRFYDHHGIDPKRTVAAVFRSVSGDLQGGSTITQQLARNLYPEEIGRARSLNRKAKEAITALKIEAAYSKDEILETYLNTVPFLYNATGIEMAARTYFDTSAATLDPLQSATLVGMLKGTSYYNPVTNPQRATERRNTVLAQMAKRDHLQPEQLAALQKQPLKVDFERQTEAVGPAPHLARQLRRWLIDWTDRNGYDIGTDGLQVRTTIDSKLQDFANRAVQRQTDQLQKSATAMWGPRAWTANKPVVQAVLRDSAPYKAAREAGADDAAAIKQVLADADAMQALREDKSRLQAGFMALDPRNGQVRAWVGSRGFEEDQFDHVAQARRQPGSTFKPFVYGTAFAQGIGPNETLMDSPVEIDLGGGQIWRPSDGGEPSYQPMTLRDGLAYSKNTITAQLMARVGAANVAQTARAMGVRQSKLDEVLSLALGTSPVTLKEMVASYGSIANGGNYIEPMLVDRIEDRNGQVLEQFQPAVPEPALAQAAAQTLLDAMRGVVDQGTGGAIRSRWGVRGDVAGKTGTTQDNTDGWFMLIHPTLVMGAWVGFNDSRITMADSWGQGARSALPIVGDFMQASLRAKALDGDAVLDAPRAPPAVPAEPVPLTPEQIGNGAWPPAGTGEGPMGVAADPQMGSRPVAPVEVNAAPAEQSPRDQSPRQNIGPLLGPEPAVVVPSNAPRENEF